MKFVLIGGAGFIGSELALGLERKNHEVTIIDNFNYDQKPWFPPGIKVIRDSIENIKTHGTVVGDADYVFFMASPRLNEINDLPQPLPYYQCLIDTTELVSSKAQLIFFSSCSVYGFQNNIVNEHSPTKITSLYSKLKIDSEKLLTNLGDDRFKIIRLSTLYGVSSVSRNDLLINNFVKDIKFSKYLEVYDPLAWRPNILLEDLVKVLVDLSEHKKFMPILNIGFDELNITKQDLVLTLVSKNRFDFTVKYYAPQDSRSYKVDFSLLKSLLSFSNFTEYKDGIQQVNEAYGR
jgi:nucleoside-diphosphate-sugar epimerase